MSVDRTRVEEETRLPEDAEKPVQPIRCALCDTALPSVGDKGTCPNCSASFDRRNRIFETYGPEAFVEEPVDDNPRPAVAWAPYRRAIIFSLVALLSIPVAQYFVRVGLVAADRMPFVIFLFAIAVFEWLRVSRDQDSSNPNEEPSQPNEEGKDSDAGRR